MPGPPPKGASSTRAVPVVGEVAQVVDARCSTSPASHGARARCPSASGRLEHAREDRDDVNRAASHRLRHAPTTSRPPARSTCAHERVGQRAAASRPPARARPAPARSPPVSRMSVDRAHGAARSVLDAQARAAGGGSTSPRAAPRAPPRRCAARGRVAPRPRRSSRRPRASARSGPCGASSASTVDLARARRPGRARRRARSAGSGRAGRRGARPATSPLRPWGFTTRPIGHQLGEGAASVQDLQSHVAAPRRAPPPSRSVRSASAVRPVAADHAAAVGSAPPRARGGRRRPRSRSSTRTRPGSSHQPAARACSSSCLHGSAASSRPRLRLASSAGCAPCRRAARPCRSSTSPARRRSSPPPGSCAGRSGPAPRRSARRATRASRPPPRGSSGCLVVPVRLSLIDSICFLSSSRLVHRNWRHARGRGASSPCRRRPRAAS